jgi:hypothetical protein
MTVRNLKAYRKHQGICVDEIQVSFGNGDNSDRVPILEYECVFAFGNKSWSSHSNFEMLFRWVNVIWKDCVTFAQLGPEDLHEPQTGLKESKREREKESRREGERAEERERESRRERKQKRE